MITTEQKVQVAKDRAIDSLIDIVHVKSGYWNLNNREKDILRKIARLISLPDNSQATLQELHEYISGEEEMYFQK